MNSPYEHTLTRGCCSASKVYSHEVSLMPDSTAKRTRMQGSTRHLGDFHREVLMHFNKVLVLGEKKRGFEPEILLMD